MILSITFSKPTPICFQKFGKPLTKIKIKPVSKGSDISYFAEMFTEKQVFHTGQTHFNDFKNKYLTKYSI